MFGIGSAIKDAFRDAVPNELADIAVKAAPFVAPFNPAIAATMAGLGSFDKTGRIGSSLKSAGKTYVGGQIARGIGGAPTQLGFTQPGTGNMFTSPFTGDALFGPEGSLTSTGLRVTRWEYSSEKLDTGLEAIDSAEDKYTLDQLNYKFSLETGQVALDGEGSIRLEQDLSTGEPQFLMNEDFTESVLQTQSSYASNTDLDTEAGFDTSSALDDILDFTERNPFGDEDN